MIRGTKINTPGHKILKETSFRGRVLAGQDFSDHSLLSCDFRDTDLSGAIFRRVRCGISLRWRLFKSVAAIVIGITLAMVMLVTSVLIVGSVQNFGQRANINEYNIYIICIVHAVCFAIAACISIVRNRPWILPIYLLIAMLLATVGSAMGYGEVTTVGVVASIALIPLGGVVGVLGWWAITPAIGLCWIATSISNQGPFLGVVSGIFILLGCYLKHRIQNHDDPLLGWLKRVSNLWACLGGTDFRGAIFAGDFSNSDLGSAKFTRASIKRPILVGVKNLRMANLRHTSLDSPKIRMLVTGSETSSSDFSYANLRGISLRGLNLSDSLLHHADLTDADLSECNLENVDLSECTALSASFDGSTLTGACIEGWSINSETSFAGTVCDYVYISRDRTKRSPPSGIYKANEFAKVSETISSTIDFIAHTPQELHALLRAIDSLKADGADLTIQSLERKSESVVLRTGSSVEIDRAKIYEEVRKEAAAELLLMQNRHEKELLSLSLKMTRDHHTESMDLLTKLAASTIIVNERVETMIDNRRYVSDSTINNSSISLGDHSEVSSNNIYKNNEDLISALNQIVSIIAASELKSSLKDEAITAVNSIKQSKDVGGSEGKNIIEKSLDVLSKIQSELNITADLGVKYGETLARIAQWFS